MTALDSRSQCSEWGTTRSWIVFGAGGHGREIAWLLRERWGVDLELKFIVDSQYDAPETVNGIPVEYWDQSKHGEAGACVIAVGDPASRENIEQRIGKVGFKFIPIVHPSVQHSEHVEFGEGSVVFAGCVLTVNVSIGRHVHINSNCTINHDVTIGDFVTLSPGVNIAGRVNIEKGAFLGANACVINGTDEQWITIGEGSVVGAGACVTRSVPKGVRVVGIPAVER